MLAFKKTSIMYSRKRKKEASSDIQTVERFYFERDKFHKITQLMRHRICGLYLQDLF